MPRVAVPFATQSYIDRSLPVSTQQLVNMYLALKPEASKSRAVLQSTPGLTPFATTGTGPSRGNGLLNTALMVHLSGDKAYRITRAGAVTTAGTIPGFGPAASVSSGRYVFFSTPGGLYYVSETGLGQISAFVSGTAMPPISALAYLDGYVVAAEQDSRRFYISELAADLGFGTDERDFDATQFGVKQALPDNIVTIAVANRHLWILGERSTEIFYNSGAAAFPLSRIPGGVIDVGCLAARSAASISGSVFWLGDDYRVYQSTGLNPKVISTSSIENRIEKFAASPESAVGGIYQQYGHTFYTLTLPEFTFVFDASTGLWHERASDQLSQDRKGWRGMFPIEFAGKRLVGDTESGTIFELDLDRHDEDGVQIRRAMVSPPLHSNLSRMTMSRFTLDMETGVGLPTGQGSDPQITLQMSDDGGRTFGTELWRSIGKIGEYHHRVIWDRLGQFRSRVMRLEVSDPVDVVSIQAHATLTAGEE